MPGIERNISFIATIIIAFLIIRLINFIFGSSKRLILKRILITLSLVVIISAYFWISNPSRESSFYQWIVVEAKYTIEDRVIQSALDNALRDELQYGANRISLERHRFYSIYTVELRDGEKY